MVRASNPGPFTLDGTRTFLVGRREVAVIDPGPEDPAHRASLVEAVAEARTVVVLVTHAHGDHAGGAAALAQELDAPLRGFGAGARPLADGESLRTDQGSLVALHTPGHARDHLALHWPRARAAFAGDLVLGEGDTTWVGEYPGSVGDYLASLERLRTLDLEVLYPAHGPPVRDVEGVLGRYESHRRERIAQVEGALREDPGASVEELVGRIYGDQVPQGLREAARRSLQAILHHLGAGNAPGPEPQSSKTNPRLTE